MVEIWSIIAIRWLKNIPIMNQNIDKGFQAWYTNNVLAQRKTQKWQIIIFPQHLTPKMSWRLLNLQWLITGTENIDTYSPKFKIMSYFAMCPGATQSLNFAKSSFFNYYTPYKINIKVHLMLLYTGTPYRDKY